MSRRMRSSSMDRWVIAFSSSAHSTPSTISGTASSSQGRGIVVVPSTWL
ncbi:Uncharacterised protein [Mycobacteroides abscessus subsp. abscessus]|nr:Uncharacterised protein [Mycobacteroides abscessus subsp. abscessus]